MTGRYKGKRGKIVEVSYLKLKIYIEGVTNTNVRGQEKNIPIEPSNVELTALNMTGHRKAVFKEVVK
jgi:ribosomal protein uL24